MGSVASLISRTVRLKPFGQFERAQLSLGGLLTLAAPAYSSSSAPTY
jgi:hypothetical protein